MKKIHIPNLVLGAGPAGLSAAYKLSQAGRAVTIVDRSKVCGGLMRNVQKGAFKVDFGRKELYSRIESVNQLWASLLGEDYQPYDYRVGILYEGHIFEKTSTYKGVLRGMSFGLFLGCTLDYLASAINPQKLSSYQDFMYKTRGRKFSQIFLQGYSEKFDRYPWGQLPIPSKDKKEVKKKYKISDFWNRSVKDTSDSKHQQAQWRHPAEGAGQIIERLEQSIKENGGQFMMGADIKEIKTDQFVISSVIVEQGGELLELIPDQVISTLPLEILAKTMKLADNQGSAPSISFGRGIILVYLFIDEPPTFPHTWLNVSSPDLKVGRITNYAAQGGRMVPSGQTAFCFEFFCTSDDELFHASNETLRDLAIKEGVQSKLLHPEHVIDYIAMKFPHADAAVSWEDYLRDPARNALFDKISLYHNLLNASRPGTDRATHAGLVAAASVMSNNKELFEQLTDPRKAEPWLEDMSFV